MTHKNRLNISFTTEIIIFALLQLWLISAIFYAIWRFLIENGSLL